MSVNLHDNVFTTPEMISMITQTSESKREIELETSIAAAAANFAVNRSSETKRNSEFKTSKEFDELMRLSNIDTNSNPAPQANNIASRRENPLALPVTFTLLGEPIINDVALFAKMSPAEQNHFKNPEKLARFFTIIFEQSRKINNTTDPIDFCNKLYDEFSKLGFPAPDLNLSGAVLVYYLPSSIKLRELLNSYTTTCEQCPESDDGCGYCICNAICCCFIYEFLMNCVSQTCCNENTPNESNYLNGAARLGMSNQNKRENLRILLQQYLKNIALLTRFPSLNLSNNQIIPALAAALKWIEEPLTVAKNVDLTPLTNKLKEVAVSTVLDLEGIGLWAAKKQSLMNFLKAILLELKTPLKSLNVSNNALYLILTTEDFKTLGEWIKQSRIPAVKLFDSNYPRDWIEYLPQGITQSLYDKFEAFLKGIEGSDSLYEIDDMFRQDITDINLKIKCEALNNALRVKKQMVAVMMAFHPRLGAECTIPINNNFPRSTLIDIFEFAGFRAPNSRRSFDRDQNSTAPSTHLSLSTHEMTSTLSLHQYQNFKSTSNPQEQDVAKDKSVLSGLR